VKVTFEQAQRVADRVTRKLGAPAWLVGVGVDVDKEEGFAVSVRVLSGKRDRVKIASRFGGVRVAVVEREPVRALAR